MDDIFALLWKRYRTWSITARNLKARNGRWKRRVLVLTLAGTACGAVTPFVGDLPGAPWPSRLAAALGTTCLATATLLARELLGATNEERWTRARAAAEAFKSEAHKYLVRAAPYDGADHVARLSARMGELDSLTKDVQPDDVAREDLTKGMPSPRWTIDEYVANRLDEQVEWYRRRAGEHVRTTQKGRVIALALGGAAVVISGVTGVAVETAEAGTFPAVLLGLVTTAGGAIGAYFQAGHFDAVATNYRATAAALERRGAALKASGPEDQRDIVVEAEAIMQAEHAGWLTEMTVKTS
jgi:hypothetical protein